MSGFSLLSATSHTNISLFVLFSFILYCFQKSFSHITTVSECHRELNAHFQSAASLKYHAPYTCHDFPPRHTIVTKD